MFADRGRVPDHRQAARRRGSLRDAAGRQRSRARERDRRPADRPRRLGRGRGVHRRPRGLLRHDLDRRPRRARLRLALLPERPRGDAHALDLAAVRHHQPRRCAGLRRLAPYGPEGHRGARHRAPLRPTWSGSSDRKGCKFSEIGCRPPGVGVWDLYAAANDFDIYREWAMAVVHGRPGAGDLAPLLRRHDRPAPESRRAHLRLRGPRTRSTRPTATASSTAHLPPPGSPTRRRRGRATWRTPGSE